MIQSAYSARYQSQKFKNERLFSDFIFDLHRLVKKSRIVGEAITRKRALEVFQGLDHAELESHFGRPFIAYLAPDELMQFEGDILICGDWVFILNFEVLSVLTIRNAAVAKLFSNYFELLKMASQKVDLNGYIRTLKKGGLMYRIDSRFISVLNEKTRYGSGFFRGGALVGSWTLALPR